MECKDNMTKNGSKSSGGLRERCGVILTNGDSNRTQGSSVRFLQPRSKKSTLLGEYEFVVEFALFFPGEIK